VVTDNGPFAIWQRNPETGERMGRLNNGLTRQQVADFMAKTGFQSPALDFYFVEHSTGTVTAEEFLEESPAETVRSAWKAGTPAASAIRQRKLHEWWPALGMALDNLEGHRGD
jgi:hypothetical protein